MAPERAVVAGGGVIGLASAFRLQQAGFLTVLIDPETTPLPASWGNAGHLAVEQTDPLASFTTIASAPRMLFAAGGPLDFLLRDASVWGPFLPRFVRAAAPDRFERGKAALTALLQAAMPAWRRLTADIGVEALIREAGHYVVWESPASAARGNTAWARKRAATAACRPADADETAQLRKMIRTPVEGAIRFEQSAQITDLPALRQALIAAFERAGGQRRRGVVDRLDISKGAPRLISRDGEEYQADIALIAAGVGAQTLLAPLGHSAPVIAERGYHIEASAPDWPFGFPPVVFEDRAVIATRFAHTLRLASFVEFARAESAADPRKWVRLRKHAEAIGLPFEGPVREWMGARPTLPDYLPAIGASTVAPNVFYAFGHQHLGLTLSAITAEAVVAIVEKRTPPVDLAPFALSRFEEPRRL